MPTPESTPTTCTCPTNESGDIRCHVCGEYVNVRCWKCGTPRGGSDEEWWHQHLRNVAARP